MRRLPEIGVLQVFFFSNISGVAKRKTLLRDLIDPKKEDIKPKF